MITAYLAAEGFETELDEELARAGLGPSLRAAHGRLRISDAAAIDAAWAANVWLNAEEIAISSIGDGARALRQRQRNWALYAPEHRGRAELIAAKLPYVSAKAIEIGDAAPRAPLGSWTLLRPGIILAATDCTSAFPNGRPPLSERHDGPPSRAYLKLWEALLRIGRSPASGEVCVDLGASPGGWTWLLRELGGRVVAVDKAPIDGSLLRSPEVISFGESAFGLDPARVGAAATAAFGDGAVMRWVCCDIACYPDRLLGLIDRWSSLRPTPTLVFTVKFQGPTDHDIIDRLRAIDGSRLFHGHHNKHELTLVLEP